MPSAIAGNAPACGRCPKKRQHRPNGQVEPLRIDALAYPQIKMNVPMAIAKRIMNAAPYAGKGTRDEKFLSRADPRYRQNRQPFCSFNARKERVS